MKFHSQNMHVSYQGCTASVARCYRPTCAESSRHQSFGGRGGNRFYTSQLWNMTTPGVPSKRREKTPAHPGFRMVQHHQQTADYRSSGWVFLQDGRQIFFTKTGQMLCIHSSNVNVNYCVVGATVRRG